MKLKPLAANARDGYVIQKQNEARNRVNIKIDIDEKQAEREIDRVMKSIVAKLNK